MRLVFSFVSPAHINRPNRETKTKKKDFHFRYCFHFCLSFRHLKAAWFVTHTHFGDIYFYYIVSFSSFGTFVKEKQNIHKLRQQAGDCVGIREGGATQNWYYAHL